jgi:integrase
MPPRKKDPSYRLHKQSGQAVVTLPNGRGGRSDVLLGKHDTDESWAEYNRVLQEWKANERRLPAKSSNPEPSGLTVNELLLAYYRHAETYYVKDGAPTSEVAAIRAALRFVKPLYGHTLAADFSPRALKAVRDAMVTHPITIKEKVKTTDQETGVVQVEERDKLLRNGLARRCINKQIGRIKRMFAWAVEEELVPVSVHQSLVCVKGLKKGKDSAREKRRIGPVPDAMVETVLPLVAPTVRTLIDVQRLCGCRPQDVVQLRAIDIDMTGPVWEYRPQRYKTQHHNEDDSPDRERIIFIGPRSQALIRPYLTLNVTDYLFSPARAEQARNTKRKQERKSPMTPSQVKRRPKANPKAPLRDHYDVGSYRKAIRRACLKAGIPIWFPLQLRHSRGTEIRKRYGLEASQAVLGHTELGVTQVYAEEDRDTARRVMGEIG